MTKTVEMTRMMRMASKLSMSGRCINWYETEVERDRHLHLEI